MWVTYLGIDHCSLGTGLGDAGEKLVKKYQSVQELHHLNFPTCQTWRIIECPKE
jgi:hypothetical protein